MRRSFALSAFIVVTMCLAFPAFGAGKEAVVVMDTDIGDISPYGATGSGRNYVKFMIYETLAQGKVFGQSLDKMDLLVAKSIKAVDSKTMKIDIYDNIVDSAGNPITADDVVFSYTTMAQSGNYEKVKSNLGYIKATGKYSVEIGLSQPKIGMMEYLVGQVLIVSRKAYEASSKEKLATQPIGTGPYMVSELVSGSRIVLVKNPKYWQKNASLQSFLSRQPLDKFTFNVVTEASQRSIALESKNCDLVTSVAASEIGRFLNDDDTAAKGYTVQPSMGGLSTVLMFNCDAGKVFDNQKLRQAVCFAVDSKALVKGALKGRGRVTNDFSTPAASDYNAAWDKEDFFKYDLAKAKKLLADSGYKAGAQKLRIMCLNQPVFKSAAEIIQAYLMQLGLPSEILAYDNALFNTYKYDSSQWDMILDQKGTTDFVVNTWSLAFDSAGFKNGTANFVHDAKFQELLKAACGVDTHSAATVEAFHDYLNDMAYAKGLFISYTYSVAVDSVKKLVIHPQGQLMAAACAYSDAFQSVTKK